ncbi:MAG TPA: glycosyltransferase family 4 protein [Solirubrobacterales bacterium]|nr:glycosyltransferase family 4 protein [Solirubrobacterales bacterium]
MKRIGVAFPGDPSQKATWSGIPSSLIGGLETAGVEAVPIGIEPPSALLAVGANAVAAAYVRPQRDLRTAVKNARQAARASASLATVTSWAVPAALHRAGRLDGVIQIGTGYTLRSEAPVVTYEDMTIPQTRTHPYAGWDLLTRRSFDSRMERQRRAYEMAAACCLTSPWAAESVLDDYGIAAEKVHVVGIGCNHVAPAVEREWAVPRFLFVGLDWERKNGPGLLRAFAHLREELPAARLDLVGGHPPVDQAGVTGYGVLRLDVREQHERLEQLFATATCFVMPSHSEASAIAYVEAATAGLPSIGTSAGGSGYLIGKGGLVVDPTDDEALLEAMRRLANPETAARMGALAKERSRLFSWDAVATRILTTLEGARDEAPVTVAG